MITLIFQEHRLLILSLSWSPLVIKSNSAQRPGTLHKLKGLSRKFRQFPFWRRWKWQFLVLVLPSPPPSHRYNENFYYLKTISFQTCSQFLINHFNLSPRFQTCSQYRYCHIILWHDFLMARIFNFFWFIRKPVKLKRQTFSFCDWITCRLDETRLDISYTFGDLQVVL